MNKRIAITGVFAAAVLAGCGASEPDVGNNVLKLPGCGTNDGMFDTTLLEATIEEYHLTVAGVIDAHINDLSDINTLPLTCTANDYRGLLAPSSALESLAARLPEWGPSRAGELSEADMGSVLLEHLRVYECALYRRSQFLEVFIIRERGTTGKVNGEDIQTISSFDLSEEQRRQQSLIEHELLTARPTLERTLAFIGGIDRLRPLTAELECLKRASLDLRNSMGLMAESASCMPKIWDARGSLRDLPE